MATRKTHTSTFQRYPQLRFLTRKASSKRPRKPKTWARQNKAPAPQVHFEPDLSYERLWRSTHWKKRGHFLQTFLGCGSLRKSARYTGIQIPPFEVKHANWMGLVFGIDFPTSIITVQSRNVSLEEDLLVSKYLHLSNPSRRLPIIEKCGSFCSIYYNSNSSCLQWKLFLLRTTEMPQRSCLLPRWRPVRHRHSIIKIHLKGHKKKHHYNFMVMMIIQFHVDSGYTFPC